MIGTRWREKERKCKKDVTQYVGYRGTRACERIVSTGRARTIARGISGLNRSSSHDLARISLLEDSESETTVHWSIYDCHGILTSSRILTQLFIRLYVYIHWILLFFNKIYYLC